MIIEYIVLIEGRWWFPGNIYVLPKIRYDRLKIMMIIHHTIHISQMCPVLDSINIDPAHGG